MQVHGGEAGVKAMQQNLPVETLQMDKQAHVIKINSKTPKRVLYQNSTAQGKIC